MGRAVRVKSQLTSHKRFANAFLKYCQLVDNARLYCTNSMGGPPKVNSTTLLTSFTRVQRLSPDIFSVGEVDRMERRSQ